MASPRPLSRRAPRRARPTSAPRGQQNSVPISELSHSGRNGGGYAPTASRRARARAVAKRDQVSLSFRNSANRRANGSTTRSRSPRTRCRCRPRTRTRPADAGACRTPSFTTSASARALAATRSTTRSRSPSSATRSRCTRPAGRGRGREARTLRGLRVRGGQPRRARIVRLLGQKRRAARYDAPARGRSHRRSLETRASPQERYAVSRRVGGYAGTIAEHSLLHDERLRARSISDHHTVPISELTGNYGGGYATGRRMRGRLSSSQGQALLHWHDERDRRRVAQHHGVPISELTGSYGGGYAADACACAGARARDSHQRRATTSRRWTRRPRTSTGTGRTADARAATAECWERTLPGGIEALAQ